MNFSRWALGLLCLCALTPGVWAAPVITSITGTYSGNADDTSANVITITGTGFGTKEVGKPWIWSTFQASTQPTTLGYLSQWDLIENAESSTTAYSGTKALCSTAGWTSDIFRARVTTGTSNVGYGEKWLIHMKRKVTYSYTDLNLKWFRLWDTNGTSGSGTQYPNHYIGTQGPTKTSRILGSEFNPDAAVTVSIGAIYPHPGQDSGNWRVEKFLLQEASAQNTADGQFHIYYIGPQGSLNGSTTSWKTDSANAAGHPEQLSLQDDPSNGTADGHVCYDDILVEQGTWARAEVMDRNTYTSASLTKSNPIVPITWSDTSITAYFHAAGFSEGETAYVFVCDNSNSCSSGYQIQIGGSFSSDKATKCPCK